jgi:hypothetical protein
MTTTKVRRAIAERLRYVAYSLQTPVWIERLLLALAEDVYRHTALTCRNAIPLVPVFDSEPVSSVPASYTRSSVPNPAERQQ